MSLIAQWKLDEYKGVTAVDAIGSNDGTWTSGELVTNGTFDNAFWVADELAGWTRSGGAEDGANFVNESVAGNQAHFKTDAARFMQMSQDTENLVVGREYTYLMDVVNVPTSSLVFQNPSSANQIKNFTATGNNQTGVFNALDPEIVLKTDTTNATDHIIDNFSVKQNILSDGRGMAFNGTSDQINIGDTSLNVKTVSLWIKQSDIAGNEYPVDLDDASYLAIESGVVTVYGFTAPLLYVNGVLGASGTTTITANQWYHIVITDTTLVDADEADIGVATGTGFFGGSISDVRFYDTVLTVNDVEILYKSTGRFGRMLRRERRGLYLNK